MLLSVVVANYFILLWLGFRQNGVQAGIHKSRGDMQQVSFVALLPLNLHVFVWLGQGFYRE